MVGRGLQVKPIKSVRKENGKYSYSAEQKVIRNAKDRARRLKSKVKELEEANTELRKVNNTLSKAAAKLEKKEEAKKIKAATAKTKKAPKEPKGSKDTSTQLATAAMQIASFGEMETSAAAVVNKSKKGATSAVAV